MIIFKNVFKETDEKKYIKEMKKLNSEYNSDILRELKAYKLKKLEINHNYKKINDYEYEKEKILDEDIDETKKQLLLLEIERKYKKISEIEYHKEYNDIKKNPWAVYNIKYDENKDPDNIAIEVIYNNCFIEKLKKLGYTGNSEDDIVSDWLTQSLVENSLQENMLSE